MLQVARLAPNLLAEAAPSIVTFLEEQLNEDGGASDREGKSDLYYTAFALDGLLAMQAELPVERIRTYLEDFGVGEELDLVHKACLARCWSAVDGGWPRPDFPQTLLAEVEANRTSDGGYAAVPGAARGTLYHAFLALGVYQDLKQPQPDLPALVKSFEGLRTRDGAYANSRLLPMGTTPATAAAVALLRQCGARVPDEVGPWLLAQRHSQGGFKAMPEAPIPDLLSTATALHALAALDLTIGATRELTLDFLDSLWTGKAFCGNWDDDTQDCEYAFYALLALGHLSLEA